MPGKSDYKIYKTIGPTVIKNLNYLDRAKSGLSLDVTPVPDAVHDIDPGNPSPGAMGQAFMDHQDGTTTFFNIRAGDIRS